MAMAFWAARKLPHLLMVVALAACGNGGNEDSSALPSGGVVGSSSPTQTPSGRPNNRPIINGFPIARTVAGAYYSFAPEATDPDGDLLRFEAINLPRWASLDPDTGTLGGTPGLGHVGVYRNIVVNVSDDESSVAMHPFSITVLPPWAVNNPVGGGPGDDTNRPSGYGGPSGSTPPSNAPGPNPNSGNPGTPPAGNPGLANGSATLTWQPPTRTANGAPLTDLAGYEVTWGTVSGSYSDSVSINNAGITSYVVDNLLSNTTYFFSMSAFNSRGVHSDYSNEISITMP